MKKIIKISIFIFGLFFLLFSQSSTLKAESPGYGWINIEEFKKNITKLKRAEIVVAVIDSGFDVTHPLLNERIVEGGATCGDNGCQAGGYELTWQWPDNKYLDAAKYHGTQVSGIIALATLNNVKILPIRLLGLQPDDNELGSLDDAVEYILERKAKGMNIKAINLSLAFMCDNEELCTPENYISITKPIEKAYNNGVLVIAGTGNTYKGDLHLNSTSFTDKTILVGALNMFGQRADFSTYGKGVDFMAPGYEIVTARLGGGVSLASGTSMAAPHITAKIALMYTICPDCSQTAIEDTLIKSSVKITDPLNCPSVLDPQNPINADNIYFMDTCGHGWVDMNKAYNILKDITFRDVKITVRGKAQVSAGLNFNFSPYNALLFEPQTHFTLSSKFLRPDRCNTYALVGNTMAFTINEKYIRKLKYIKIKIGKKTKKIKGKELDKIRNNKYYLLENITEDVQIEFKFTTWWIF